MDDDADLRRRGAAVNPAPDLGGQLTAIAAGPENWREVSSLSLMR